jgi:S1-C subfamily serine protease
MNKSLMLGFVCSLTAAACGGDDAYPEFAQRDATGDECPQGGTVLLVDGRTQATVCDGEDGTPGAMGVPGERGEDGTDGTPGTQGAAGPAGLQGGAGTSASAEVVELASCVSALRSNMVVIQCATGVVDDLGTPDDPADDVPLFDFGSGTVTPQGTIITAGHVVTDAVAFPCDVFDVDVNHVALLGSVTAETPDGLLDVATLGVDWEGVPPTGVPPVVSPPSLGDMTMATGHPNVLDAIQISPGFVTATNVSEFGEVWDNAFLADYSSNGGGSGGAVFNADCEWIGVHVGGFADGLELSIAMPFTN